MSQSESDEDKQKQVIQYWRENMTSKPIYMEKEESLLEGIKEDGIDVENNDAAKLLVKALAAFQILHTFEQIYNFIWGSQIAFLQALNEYGALSMQQFEGCFEEAKLNVPEHKDLTIDEYYELLFDRDLIEKGKIKDEEAVYITDKGKEFLMWMVEHGRTDNKPL